MSRVSSRRSSKLEELYSRHLVETRRLAYLLTGDRSLAEDLTQDAFINCFGRLAHLRDEASFRTYLRRTLVNLAKRRYRRNAVERRHLAREVSTASSTQAPYQPEDESLREALMELPYKQRAAVVLRFYADLPDDEIGQILDCASGTVRSLVSRGLSSLRAAADWERFAWMSLVYETP